VIHVELALADSGMRFAAGDAVGVLPHNDPALVAGLLARLEVDGDDVFAVESASGESGNTSEGLMLVLMKMVAPARKLSASPAAVARQGRSHEAREACCS
jgi:sulfite reductase alpha subunit-like flavoprotein